MITPKRAWFPDEPEFSAAVAEVRARATKKKLIVEDEIVRLEIIEYMHSYLAQRTAREVGYFKGVPRTKRIKEVSAALSYLSKQYEAFLSTPGYIAPLVWGLESDSAHQDWTEAEYYVSDFLRKIQHHDKWLKAAVEACDTPSKGRPEGALERDLISNFVDIFEDHTESKATANRPSQGKHPDKKRTGSFVIFVDAIITDSPVLSRLKVDWRQRLVDALKKRKKQRKAGYDFESDKIARASRRHRFALRQGMGAWGINVSK